MNRGDRPLRANPGGKGERGAVHRKYPTLRWGLLRASVSAVLLTFGVGLAAATAAGAQDPGAETTTTARGSGGVIDPTATTVTTIAEDAATATTAPAGAGVTGASGQAGASTTVAGADSGATTTNVGTVDTASTSGEASSSESGGNEDRVLNLVIIGLLVLAALIAIATILFWRSTVPERIDEETDDSAADELDGEHLEDGDDSSDELVGGGVEAAPVLAPPRVRVGAPSQSGSANAGAAASAPAITIAGPLTGPSAGAFSVPPPTHLPAPAERPYAQRPAASTPEPAQEQAPVAAAADPRPSAAAAAASGAPAPGSWSVPAPEDAGEQRSDGSDQPAPFPVEKLAPPAASVPAESADPAPEPEPPLVVRRNRSKKRGAGPWGEGAKMGQRAEIPDPTHLAEGTEFSRGVRIVPAPGTDPEADASPGDGSDNDGIGDGT